MRYLEKRGITGFTLVEILVAMAIFVTAITAVSAIFSFSNKTQRITQAGLVRLFHLAARALDRDFGLAGVPLGVAALNPHASEDGMFGHEEEEIIIPAVKEAQAAGLAVEGPFPADTLFWRHHQGEFAAIICMYHDQGLIPLKLLHFMDGVNVTLGLPIIRTTAFISLGLLVGQLIESLGWTTRLGRLVWPAIFICSPKQANCLACVRDPKRFSVIF